MTTESLRAFATRNARAVSYMHAQKAKGRLVMVNIGGKELVDVEASMARMASSADPAKAYVVETNDAQRAMHRGPQPLDRPVPTPAGQAFNPEAATSKNATYMQAKTAREVYDAKMSQLDYERETGKLIKKQEVESALFEIARAVRDGLTNSARRIAAEVSSLTTSDECEAVIDRENRAILENMTKAFKDRLQSEAVA